MTTCHLRTLCGHKRFSTPFNSITSKVNSIQIIPSTPPFTLATPSDIRVGPFARECQISHLVGRVLRHVISPIADATFHREEALQLERTLQSFMPILMEEQTKYGLYCAALGICVK